MQRIVRHVILPSVLSWCFLLAGCASIVTGENQSVYVASSPSSALVTLNGKQAGNTPVTLSLRRKSTEAIVGIELDGFERQDIALNRKINGWVWGNIMFGGIIGLVIDMSSGAMYTYKLPENEATAAMSARAEGGPESSPEGSPEGIDIWIDVVLKPDPKLTKIGQLIPVS